jgi:hypothetical protein
MTAFIRLGLWSWFALIFGFLAIWHVQNGNAGVAALFAFAAGLEVSAAVLTFFDGRRADG